MAKIFICYRRTDSGGHAGRVYDRLAARFGDDRIYIDIHNIPPGVDFVEHVRQAMQECAAVIVLIGQRWLVGENRKRLNQPDDHVRQEIEQALESMAQVYPVLVQDARMPAQADLPEDIRPLARRNAIEIRDASFEADVQPLIKALEGLEGLKPPGETVTSPAPSPESRTRRRIVRAATGLGCLLLMGVVAFFIPNPSGFETSAFRVLFSLAAGAFVAIVADFVEIAGRWQKVAVSAGAGLAAFILVYTLDPAKAMDKTSGPGVVAENTQPSAPSAPAPDTTDPVPAAQAAGQRETPAVTGQPADTAFFVAPTTQRSGDSSAALAVLSDGSALSLLPDQLSVSLQTRQDRLSETVTLPMTIGITRSAALPVESVVNHLRGAIFLSEGASALILLTVGGRVLQYSFPFGPKPGLRLEGDLYQDPSFFRQATTPIDWTVPEGGVMYYPITISITVERRTTDDIALVQIDSLDAAVRLESGQ